MSTDLLLALQEAHAFDPFPVRDDLGVYHVPFSELAGDGHIEEALGDGCRRVERIGIVGDSGTGKSSLTARVLGPLAEGVAPIVVPVPVLVFDDADRWLSGTFRDHDDLARSFFGRVLPALAGLRCSVVVAVHRRYLVDGALRAGIDRVLETLIELPELRNPDAVGAVLFSRVHAHRPEDNATLADVIAADAVSRLFELYRTGLRGELRGVLRTAHVALADACDSGADLITTPMIDAASAAWDSA
ncbi:MAG: hypothetical protein ACRDPR_01125 [Nocardioidaceae bacterium]